MLCLNKDPFFQHLAQTGPSPISLEPVGARGCWLTDKDGNKYFDLISGVNVSNLGHCNHAVIRAIKKQVNLYTHLMVYGEYVLSPQVQYAGALAELLPSALQSVYFVNSGSEAVEGGIKLARRYTGRVEMVSFINAYHGSTMGALSVMGNEELKSPFRPLIPGTTIIPLNDVEGLKAITTETAGVIIEPIQGEAGVRIPNREFMNKLRKVCTETGSLLIFDEIQTGLGRTGETFAFEHFGVIPDILLLGKALGGGLPLGAFISSPKIMSSLAYNPPFGHITTFGGHPLSCAAGFAALKETKDLIDAVRSKGDTFKYHLKHPAVKEIRGIGLMLAVEFENELTCRRVITECLKNGIITETFLFDARSIRIAPPLTIKEKEIRFVCGKIVDSIIMSSK